MHVLAVVHGRAEIIVRDVEAKVAGTFVGIRNSAVDVDLCVQHGNGGRAGVTVVIETVAACSYASTIGFRLLRPDCADEVGIGDITVEWDLGLFDEEDGAGAFDFLGLGAISADTVGEESAPFIGEAF